jgi:hypothetical protein
MSFPENSITRSPGSNPFATSPAANLLDHSLSVCNVKKWDSGRAGSIMIAFVEGSVAVGESKRKDGIDLWSGFQCHCDLLGIVYFEHKKDDARSAKIVRMEDQKREGNLINVNKPEKENQRRS